MSATTYTVTKPVLHDRKRYRPGDPITLEPEHAEPLRKAGHIDTLKHIASVAIASILDPTTLSKFTLPELQKYAAQQGVQVPVDATKAQILEAVALAVDPPNR